MSYLDVCQISKQIRGETILDNVSLSCELGEVVGLEGRNGSGKTMLMRVMCGLVRPTSGEVAIDGATLWKDISFPPSAGILIETPAILNNYSGIDNLELLAMVKGIATTDDLREAIGRVGLDPDNRKRCRTYSLGMRQRLGIAMALMEKPQLLILDEPTSGLDDSGVVELIDIIAQERQRGACVVVSSHDKDFLDSVCTRSCHMDAGRLTPPAGKDR